MKRHLIILIVLLFSTGAMAQVVYNSGAGILSQEGSYWVVSGGEFILTADYGGSTTFDNLKILDGATLTVDAETAVTINNDLNVEGNLVLESNETGMAGVLTNGTVTGLLESTSAERYMTGDKWHLMASPVGGQSISGVLTNYGNDIAQNANGFAMMDYLESSDSWNSYFTVATTGDFVAGKGYAVRRETNGIVTLDGSIPQNDVAASVSKNGTGWNLIGNPFPTALGITSNAESTDKFLEVNTNNLDPSYMALYLWVEEADYNGDRNDYKILNNAGSGSLVMDYLQMGQGFFVKVKDGASSVSFTKDMRSIQPDVEFKAASTPWPAINLVAETNDNASSSRIAFHNQMTKGLDVSFDAGMYKTQGTEFAVYTRLVEDNGVDFAIQCLPDDLYSELIIPVGLDAKTGSEITFTAENTNLTNDCNVILEDREKNIFTRLDTDGSFYKVKLTNESKGIGRFYIHTSNSTTSNEIQLRDQFNIIPQKAYGILKVFGMVKEKTLASVYDISGRLIIKKELQTTDVNEIRMQSAKSGVYIVQLQSEMGIFNKKISW